MDWINFSDPCSAQEPAKGNGLPAGRPLSRRSGEPNPGSDPREGAWAALLPWSTSILVHLALVMVAIFVVWTTTRLTPDEGVMVPEVTLGQSPRAPMQLSPTRCTTELRLDQQLNRHRRVASEFPVRATPAALDEVKPRATVLGVAGPTTGARTPFGLAVGDRPGGSMYALPAGDAKTIVYVIDASGSLIDTLPFVLNELGRSIRSLSPRQSFAVLFFQDGRAIEAPPRGLSPANAEMKRRVMRWIQSPRHIVPSGSSSPVAAVRRALAYRPDLVYLLSDNVTGTGPHELNQKELIQQIQKANTAHTKINTIQFLYPDPLQRIGLTPTLKLISQTTGGQYKFIDGHELGLH